MRSSCYQVCASHPVGSGMRRRMLLPWPRRSASLLALVFLILLFSTSLAGRHCRSSVDQDALRQQREVQSSRKAELASSEAEQKEAQPLVHARMLSVVKTNDYASYDPAPAMEKPRSKIIPN